MGQGTLLKIRLLANGLGQRQLTKFDKNTSQPYTLHNFMELQSKQRHKVPTDTHPAAAQSAPIATNPFDCPLIIINY